VVNLLETKHFGKILMIEVGALFAGRICNHPVQCFRRGEEKGYFRLGGSSILMLLQKDAVQLDEDILEYTEKGIEVKLRYREDIGTSV
jgi:phosphatidylserine decarboxylase